MGVDNWSTDPSGNDLQGNIDWSEGMAPAKVNDSAREMMAQIAKNILDRSGALTSTGSAGVYALATNTGITQLKAGLRFTFKANFSSVGGDTLNVDGKGAKKLRIVDDDGERNIEADEIDADGFYDVIYNTAGNGDAGAWIVQTADFTAITADIASVQSSLTTHTADTDNPHSVTKAQVGLGNADNISAADMPVSTATQSALDDIQTEVDAKADLSGAVFSGVITAPAIVSTRISGGGQDETEDFINGIYVEDAQIWDDLVGGYGAVLTARRHSLRGFNIAVLLGDDDLDADLVFRRMHSDTGFSDWITCWTDKNFDPSLKANKSNETFSGLTTITKGVLLNGLVTSSDGDPATSTNVDFIRPNDSTNTFHFGFDVPYSEDGISGGATLRFNYAELNRIRFYSGGDYAGYMYSNSTQVVLRWVDPADGTLGSYITIGAGEFTFDGHNVVTEGDLSAIDVGVTDVRLGSSTTKPATTSGSTTAGSGAVVTGISQGGGNVSDLYVRPIQKYVDGTWYTVSQV